MASLKTSVSLLLSVVAATPVPSDNEIQAMWSRFTLEQQLTYPNASHRFNAFRTNVLEAHALNEEQGVNCTDLFDGPECVFGITQFSAMWQDEFAATRLGYRRGNSSDEYAVIEEDLPEASKEKFVDWRKKGAVTAVKDQGDCGSCWAFSTTSEIESQVFMATGKLEVLSTQQLISCDKKDDGCDGGDPPAAYAYVKKAGGLDTEKDYPDKSHTTGKTGKCTWDKKKAAKISGFKYAVKPCSKGACKHQKEERLAAVLAAKGPMSVCVNAGAKGWQSYKKGIYHVKCSGAAKDLDHCVQLVGYNKKGKVPYWIVRNSWNTDWGIDGYMHLAMGKNLCGIADEATMAEVTTENADTLIV